MKTAFLHQVYPTYLALVGLQQLYYSHKEKPKWPRCTEAKRLGACRIEAEVPVLFARELEQNYSMNEYWRTVPRSKCVRDAEEEGEHLLLID